MMRIEALGQMEILQGNEQIKKSDINQPTGFSDFLKQALENVNALEQNADNSRMLLASGKIDNLHQVMIDAEKAAIAVQFTVQIRNKVMEAYNEIMRMQLG